MKNKLKQVRSKTKEALNSGELIANKYIMIKILGSGVSSHVVMAKHRITEEIVAIKKIKSFLTNIHESTRVMREIILLRHLKHPNIIQLKEVIVEGDLQNVTVYLVLQYLQKDIKKIFYSNESLNIKQIKRVVFQILAGLKYCHQSQVLHRDLKPENILTNDDLTEVKLCDFGLARVVILEELKTEYNRIKSELMALGIKKQQNQKDQKAPPNLSIHVATRWYRAPELILLQKKYGSAIDVWSVGCILGQLLTMMKQNSQSVQSRKPLFPGKACYPLSPPKSPEMNYQKINDFPHSVYDQLTMIFKVIGTPEDISFISDDRARHYLKSFGKIEKTPFKQIFNYLPQQVEDFLQKTLKFNPNQRLTVYQAINHPLFKDLKNQYADILSLQGKAFQFDVNMLSKEQIYKLVMQEQQYYQNQEKQQNVKSKAKKSNKMQEQNQSQMIPQ